MRKLWINNQSIESASSQEILVLNPATEEVIDSIPKGSPEDVELAVQSARMAFPEWSALAPSERRTVLKKIARGIENHAENIAKILTEEQGKPLPQAQAEVGGIVGMIEEYAELAVAFRSGSQGSALGDLVFQRWEPRGVAACIVPWNFPLQVAFETIAPNLAVGNTVVVKPASVTPLSLRYIAEIAFDELPPGVCNVLLGSGSITGEALIRHPEVDVIMFIGSEDTGRHIGRIAGENLKKSILELGGKDVLIIDDSIDVEITAKHAADACYANAGQICTSTERVYVQDTIYNQFIEALVAESEKIRWGNGLEEGITMGPIIDETQRDLIDSHVQEALSKGARLLVGGEKKSINSRGYFYPPTVITDVSLNSKLIREETFGPVAPVMKFSNFSDAIKMANNSPYGLSAIAYTQNSTNALEFIQKIEAGMVKVNTRRGKSHGATSEPFKLSGLGNGYGIEVMQELTRQKSIHWRSKL
ncbi:aldehyde dehydrogenase family protein [Bacillus sp. JJ1521]|uniref:aldehyde dehydrogenase family protein n=1 Tax=Bacillus sp. JJ1521 TaxID=3122957 RepID=UPI002FFDBC8C